MAMMNNYGYPPSTPIIWVDSEAEARSTPIVPGSTAFFMERQNQRFYVKATLVNGEVSSFKTFEFTEVVPPPPEVQTNTRFVTEEKFYEALEDLKHYINDAVKPRNRNNYKEKENHG